ncbi:MAG TPA: OmpA family protein [Chitinophagaceae bacterium]|jgi:outer membrane protein OmpA-like peptidoglycan-associated protein
MKKSGLILLVSLICFYSYSQVRIGLAGGPSVSSVRETNDLPGWDSISSNYSSRSGMHIGIIADIRLAPKSKFFFQPGVFFYNKGRKYSSPIDTSGNVKTYTWSQLVNYMDMPLNLVLKLPLGNKVKFIIGGGPYFSFFYNGKEKTETVFNNGTFQSDENNDLAVGTKPGQYKTFDYGLNALAGFEIGRVSLTANYSQGLADFYTPPYQGHLNHQVIGATLAVFLGKAGKKPEEVKDRDKDGIPDNEDGCPAEPGTRASAGCPDKDGDGIADKSDKCPSEAGTLANHGCPSKDSDGDGVPDDQDKCPSVAGVVRYKGCPIPDSDHDGINDEEDKCPKVAGVARYGGCPVPDTDKDGVNDEEDKCPAVAGVKENNGCPPIKKEIIEKVNYAARRIQFEKAKSNLLPASLPVLGEVAKILEQNRELTLTIEGHTSNAGIYEENMKLSRQRANAVKQYFESKGIDPSRLHAEGFGPNKPLNTGKTPAEEALNRRVELKLGNQ